MDYLIWNKSSNSVVQIWNENLILISFDSNEPLIRLLSKEEKSTSPLWRFIKPEGIEKTPSSSLLFHSHTKIKRSIVCFSMKKATQTRCHSNGKIVCNATGEIVIRNEFLWSIKKDFEKIHLFFWIMSIILLICEKNIFLFQMNENRRRN